MSGNFFADTLHDLRLDYEIADELFELLLKEADRAMVYFNSEIELEESIQRVRELHKQSDDGGCIGCGIDSDWEWSKVYPCPTIKALDGK